MGPKYSDKHLTAICRGSAGLWPAARTSSWDWCSASLETTALGRAAVEPRFGGGVLDMASLTG